MTARSANAWWLLPGGFALVAVAVLDLRGGQLSGAAVDVGTGLAWYVGGAVAYMARPANRAAWLFLVMATTLAIGKGVGAGVSLAAATNPDIAHEWAAVVLVDAAGWAVLAAGVAVFAMFPDGNISGRTSAGSCAGCHWPSCRCYFCTCSGPHESARASSAG